jgi:hypothetical protein
MATQVIGDGQLHQYISYRHTRIYTHHWKFALLLAWGSGGGGTGRGPSGAQDATGPDYALMVTWYPVWSDPWTVVLSALPGIKLHLDILNQPLGQDHGHNDASPGAHPTASTPQPLFPIFIKSIIIFPYWLSGLSLNLETAPSLRFHSLRAFNASLFTCQLLLFGAVRSVVANCQEFRFPLCEDELARVLQPKGFLMNKVSAPERGWCTSVYARLDARQVARCSQPPAA